MSRAPGSPQFFKNASEAGKLLMAIEVHMDDLYATDIEDAPHHTLEHLRDSVALEIVHQGMPGSYEHLKRLRCRRGDTLELSQTPNISRA